jgi:3-methyladenine DNA glycosylase AlkC
MCTVLLKDGRNGYMAKKIDTEEKTQGVPKETPQRNAFEILARHLGKAIGAGPARIFVDGIIGAGYFDLALLDQYQFLAERLAALPDQEKVQNALLQSEVDKLQSLAVSVKFIHQGDNLDVMVKFLYLTGALPGTWTQETSQSVLKNLFHQHGLAKVLPKVSRWATNNDPAVRRMLIEALRPRGVWCKHLSELKRDPSILKPILELVLDDPSIYVRKAVANNLNDISKDNPELVCKWVREWLKGKISPEREWVIQRALRSLVKDGDPIALALLKFEGTDRVKITWKKGTPEIVSINDSIPFTIGVANLGDKPVKARLQVIMIGPGKGDKRRISRYLLGTVAVAKGESKELTKSIKFAHRNSVPKVRGNYDLQLSCNGRDIDKRSFDYLGEDL